MNRVWTCWYWHLNSHSRHSILTLQWFRMVNTGWKKNNLEVAGYILVRLFALLYFFCYVTETNRQQRFYFWRKDGATISRGMLSSLSSFTNQSSLTEHLLTLSQGRGLYFFLPKIEFFLKPNIRDLSFSRNENVVFIEKREVFFLKDPICYKNL